MLHELCASSAEDRANWVETLTKASRFSKGSGDEKRQAALSKSFLVTTRATSGRGIAGAGLGGAGTGTGRAGAGAGAGFGARSSGRIDRSRCVSLLVALGTAVFVFCAVLLPVKEFDFYPFFSRCVHLALGGCPPIPLSVYFCASFLFHLHAQAPNDFFNVDASGG